MTQKIYCLTPNLKCLATPFFCKTNIQAFDENAFFIFILIYLLFAALPIFFAYIGSGLLFENFGFSCYIFKNNFAL